MIALTPTSYPADPAVEAIVAAAGAAADVRRPRGHRHDHRRHPARSRRRPAPRTAAPSPLLGNFIADVQLSATDGPDEGGAQIAFMNPGGLRADLLRVQPAREAAGDVTYAEAAVVQPFANTLFTLTLTGAADQAGARGAVPAGRQHPAVPGTWASRRGFRYGFDDTAPRGSRIHSITLNGTPIDPAAHLPRVTQLLPRLRRRQLPTLGQGTDRRDTGRDDLSVLVALLPANSPITPDTTDRAVPGPAPVTPPDDASDHAPDHASHRAPDAAAHRPGHGAAAAARRPGHQAPGRRRPLRHRRRRRRRTLPGRSGARRLPRRPARWPPTRSPPVPPADVQGGPVLLVGRDAVPAVTRAELTRLRPQRIVVLGGSRRRHRRRRPPQLQAFTTGDGDAPGRRRPLRHGGAVATSAFSAPVAAGLPRHRHRSADALAAGAAGARTDSPVLLVTRDRLPAATAAALTAAAAPRHHVVGGPAAVSDAVLAQLAPSPSVVR